MAYRRRPRGVKIAAGAVLIFLHFPIVMIALYAFSTEESSFEFPPPGLTAKWFNVAWGRQDVRDAMSLSLKVAAISTALALVLGTLVAGAVWRTRFFGRNALSLMIVLPIALPGIVTGIALRASINLAGVSFSIWTLVVGHATFCVAVAYNNVIARLRRTNPSMIDASMDLGAHGWQTFRHVIFPQLGSAIVTGGLLAFALSFDEVIVTTFTAGNQETVPIWIFSQLVRPRDRPVTNVVALSVIILTMLPIIFAVRMSERGDDV